MTTSCLKQVGTVPVDRELLIMERRLGPLVSKTSFRRAVGTQSRGQVEGFMVETICVREASVMGLKQSSLEEQTSGTARSQADVHSNILNF